MQYVQEFYQTVRDKCFKICVTSPGSSLSSSEQKCLGRCMDRYQDVRVFCFCLERRRRRAARRALVVVVVPRSHTRLPTSHAHPHTQQATNVVTKSVLSQQGMN
jgi:hypothetical protein